MVQAIFFDLFETLITERETRNKYGISIRKELNINKTEFDRIWAELEQDRFKGIINFNEALCILCERTHVLIDDAKIDQIAAKRIEAKSAPLKGVEQRIVESLEKIRATNIKIGLISNCTAEEVVEWERSLLAQQFNDVIFSFQVGLLKPDPGIYLLACRRLSVEPADSLFVGDGSSNELMGALQVGMTPCWASWYHRLWPQSHPYIVKSREASKHFREFRDISALVEGVVGGHVRPNV